MNVDTDKTKTPLEVTAEHNDRIAKLTFASVYPHYVTKVEKKGRTVAELHQVIEWLTGFDEKKLKALIEEQVTFKTFNCPTPSISSPSSSPSPVHRPVCPGIGSGVLWDFRGLDWLSYFCWLLSAKAI